MFQHAGAFRQNASGFERCYGKTMNFIEFRRKVGNPKFEAKSKKEVIKKKKKNASIYKLQQNYESC